jgi:hypothetical protein
MRFVCVSVSPPVINIPHRAPPLQLQLRPPLAKKRTCLYMALFTAQQRRQVKPTNPRRKKMPLSLYGTTRFAQVDFSQRLWASPHVPDVQTSHSGSNRANQMVVHRYTTPPRQIDLRRMPISCNGCTSGRFRPFWQRPSEVTGIHSMDVTFENGRHLNRSFIEDQSKNGLEQMSRTGTDSNRSMVMTTSIQSNQTTKTTQTYQSF